VEKKIFFVSAQLRTAGTENSRAKEEMNEIRCLLKRGGRDQKKGGITLKRNVGVKGKKESGRKLKGSETIPKIGREKRRMEKGMAVQGDNFTKISGKIVMERRHIEEAA